MKTISQYEQPSLVRATAMELTTIILASYFPMLIAYKHGGLDELNSTITSLLANSMSLTYSAMLAVVYLLFVLLIRYFHIASNKWKTVFSDVRTVLSEVGASFLGLMRAGSGVMLTFPMLWYCNEPQSFSILKVQYFLTYGALGFVECIIFSVLYKIFNDIGKPDREMQFLKRKTHLYIHDR